MPFCQFYQKLSDWLDWPCPVKVPILKEVTSEKCNSAELNTFSTVSMYKDDVKVFNSTVLHFSEVYFFQNWYFSAALQNHPQNFFLFYILVLGYLFRYEIIKPLSEEAPGGH